VQWDKIFLLRKIIVANNNDVFVGNLSRRNQAQPSVLLTALSGKKRHSLCDTNRRAIIFIIEYIGLIGLWVKEQIQQYIGTKSHLLTKKCGGANFE